MDKPMNIYEKLLDVRCKLQKLNLKKTGENKFAKYFYYELQDFLPTINILCNETKLIPLISFNSEFAVMTLVDAEKPEDKVVFTSPISSADMKGCQPVQNLGGLETYQRRYLYVMAFEIVEHDALDPIVGSSPVSEYISAEEEATIMQWITSTSSDLKKFCKAMGVESLAKLPKADFNKAINALKNKGQK